MRRSSIGGIGMRLPVIVFPLGLTQWTAEPLHLVVRANGVAREEGAGVRRRKTVQTVRTAEREFAPAHPTFAVAEAGIDHRGSLETVRHMICVAVSADRHAARVQ